LRSEYDVGAETTTGFEDDIAPADGGRPLRGAHILCPIGAPDNRRSTTQVPRHVIARTKRHSDGPEAAKRCPLMSPWHANLMLCHPT
jgi:hypothetical protein